MDFAIASAAYRPLDDSDDQPITMPSKSAVVGVARDERARLTSIAVMPLQRHLRIHRQSATARWAATCMLAASILSSSASFKLRYMMAIFGMVLFVPAVNDAKEKCIEIATAKHK